MSSRPVERGVPVGDGKRVDELCINTLRTLAMDMVQKANSGHPGAPMGAAPMAFTLWDRHLKHNPANPDWPDRDRFVLSPGHACALLYGLLHLSGYDLPLSELQRFRQLGSLTPGHPEHGLTPGVEATTGPLGSGFSTAVGMAMAERALAARFNRPGHEIVDHFTYGICSDGDLMEGVASEAASLAGTLGLGKLIFLYDDNEISIEGSTDLSFREDVGARFQAYGWHVQHVEGTDLDSIDDAIRVARDETDQPSLIIAETVIAQGSPNKAGTAASHGSPLGEDEVRLTKRAFGWPEEPPFHIPTEALEHFRQALPGGADAERHWQQRLGEYRRVHPQEAETWDRVHSGALPDDLEAQLPSFASEDGALATRAASGRVLNSLAGLIDGLVGGSADLAPSNNTNLKGKGSLGPDGWAGSNIHFGVREFAMGCVVNGLALHGGLVPYAATFLVFSDYMRASLRLAAIQELGTVFVFTHDSIGVGEDGPTHQPVEQLSSLRAIPGLTVIRPADANETAAAWACALRRGGPTALIFCRQGLPVLDDLAVVRSGVPHGGYTLVETPADTLDVLLIATGSEVPIAMEAQKLLAEEGVGARVVSLPSWELFEEQPDDYRESVMPRAVPARVAVEAGAAFGWERFVGDLGEIVALDRFGASGPAGSLYKEFGLTPEAVAAAARRTVARVAERG